MGIDLSDETSHIVLDTNGTGRAPMLIGYARTSTSDQTAGLVAQERDLKAAGAKKVYAEQTSSVARRDALRSCLDFVVKGMCSWSPSRTAWPGARRNC